MIELAHQLDEPSDLARHRARYPTGPWKDKKFLPVKLIVRRQLNLEQHGFCVYCETKLGQDDGHVEHIKSKSVNPPLTFDYSNLAHSCNGPGHCGSFKLRQCLAIEPRPGCNRYFSLMESDGRLGAAMSLSPAEIEHVVGTVRILGLDNPSLAKRRMDLAKTIRTLPREQWSDFIASIPFRWTMLQTYRPA